MTTNQSRLAPEERRALLYGPLYRILGTPVVALLGLANTAIVVRETGEAVYGLVSLVATITLLFPFADLGIGATVINASAMLVGGSRDQNAVDVIRRAYRVLVRVAGVLIAVAVCVMALDGWSAVVGIASGPEDRWAITVAACVFALTIPAGLGPRILVGIDRNPLATLVLMSCPAFGLGLTVFLYAIDASGIWYAVSALGGLLIGQTVGTVLALRLSGLGWSAFSRVSPSRHPFPLACRQHVAVRRGDRPANWLAGRTGSARAPLDTRGAVALRLDGTDLRNLLADLVYRSAGVLADLRQEAGSR